MGPLSVSQGPDFLQLTDTVGYLFKPTLTNCVRFDFPTPPHAPHTPSFSLQNVQSPLYRSKFSRFMLDSFPFHGIILLIKIYFHHVMGVWLCLLDRVMVSGLYNHVPLILVTTPLRKRWWLHILFFLPSAYDPSSPAYSSTRTSF